MIETIYFAIIAALPSIAAIVGIIASIIKMIKSNDGMAKEMISSLNTLTAEMHNTKEMDEMKAAMLALAQSNRDLQKRYDELLTEVTKIKHGEV